LGTKITKIRELKLRKSRNKILKIWEQKLQKLGNKDQKKSGKQNFKNMGTKATKISKIWEQKIQEQKFQKSRNKS
jgi:hypothetical protein